MDLFLDDTIAAIATSAGEAGIGIVRMSGKKTLEIADAIFVPKSGIPPSQCAGYTMHYGFIAGELRDEAVCMRESNKGNNNAGNQRNYIDEVLLTVMRAPKSYTREDMIEINCHGGMVALRAVLDLVLAKGCRLAYPGEFTRRAFLNGRIDLSQSEAVLDIIKAKTESALRMGVQQLKGVLSVQIKRIRKGLLDMQAVLEANIDFPEEEIDSAIGPEVVSGLGEVDESMKKILFSSQQARACREGVYIVICGMPNVGKSSLLNAFLKRERAIVTHIPGTTRDTIEEILDINGIPVVLVDTAGIVKPTDLLSKKAMQRTGHYVRRADIIMVMFDGSRSLSKEDESLFRKAVSKPAIAVINKIDLRQRINKGKIMDKFRRVVEISAKNSKNIDVLRKSIADLVSKDNILINDSVLVSNTRHIQALKKAQKRVARAKESAENGLSVEFISEDIKDAVGYLDEILGNKFREDILERIFSEFCIGK